MLGTYDRTPNRTKVWLDGWWDLVTDPEERGEADVFYREFPDEESVRVLVPGVWETELGLEDYQGVNWYRKVFEAPFAGRCRIVFGAVAYLARVWLNGELLGEHEGDFTAFSFLAELGEGDNELVVRVDNRHTDESLPKEVVDWYPYGGITRSVCCEQVPAAFLERVQFVGRPSGTVQARVWVRNTGAETVQLPIRLLLPDSDPAEQTLVVGEDGLAQCLLESTIEDAESWSPEHPALYEAQVEAGSDLYVSRIGLREVRTAGHRLLLNDEPLWLRGVNRHEDHPDWGFALPDRIMKRDIDIIQSLNCNAVRGSHYPNHPTFLDLCDEAGLLFFAEVPGWQYSAYQLSNSPTREKLETMLEEMILEQYNHPSIIIWSLHNECDTEVDRAPGLDVRSATEALYARARELDDTRLITHVSHRHWHDKHYDLADLVCLNQYIGWYVDDLEGADLAAYLRRMVEYVSDKPILMTEFGAGGLAGVHSLGMRKWSEEHQAHHVYAQIAEFRDNEHVAGCFVWQYCDINVNPDRAIRRPRSMNNKGVVDEYRRPKMAYHVVRDMFEYVADEEADREDA